MWKWQCTRESAWQGQTHLHAEKSRESSDDLISFGKSFLTSHLPFLKTCLYILLLLNSIIYTRQKVLTIQDKLFYYIFECGSSSFFAPFYLFVTFLWPIDHFLIPTEYYFFTHNYVPTYMLNRSYIISQNILSEQGYRPRRWWTLL